MTEREEPMNKDEFCQRFVTYMVQHAGETFNDGTSIREYAEDTAPTYWDNPDQRAEGPDECASADMSYWEE
jgi:predicted HD phosphohydrolase